MEDLKLEQWGESELHTSVDFARKEAYLWVHCLAFSWKTALLYRNSLDYNRQEISIWLRKSPNNIRAEEWEARTEASKQPTMSAINGSSGFGSDNSKSIDVNRVEMFRAGFHAPCSNLKYTMTKCSHLKLHFLNWLHRVALGLSNLFRVFCQLRFKYLWRHFQTIQADPANIVNVGMIDRCGKSHLWRFKGISEREATGGSQSPGQA